MQSCVSACSEVLQHEQNRSLGARRNTAFDSPLPHPHPRKVISLELYFTLQRPRMDNEMRGSTLLDPACPSVQSYRWIANGSFGLHTGRESFAPGAQESASSTLPHLLGRGQASANEKFLTQNRARLHWLPGYLRLGSSHRGR